jgi:hypothetical protein
MASMQTMNLLPYWKLVRFTPYSGRTEYVCGCVTFEDHDENGEFCSVSNQVATVTFCLTHQPDADRLRRQLEGDSIQGRADAGELLSEMLLSIRNGPTKKDTIKAANKKDLENRPATDVEHKIHMELVSKAEAEIVEKCEQDLATRKARYKQEQATLKARHEQDVVTRKRKRDVECKAVHAWREVDVVAAIRYDLVSYAVMELKSQLKRYKLIDSCCIYLSCFPQIDMTCQADMTCQVDVALINAQSDRTRLTVVLSVGEQDVNRTVKYERKCIRHRLATLNIVNMRVIRGFIGIDTRRNMTSRYLWDLWVNGKFPVMKNAKKLNAQLTSFLDFIKVTNIQVFALGECIVKGTRADRTFAQRHPL